MDLMHGTVGHLLSALGCLLLLAFALWGSYKEWEWQWRAAAWGERRGREWRTRRAAKRRARRDGGGGGASKGQ